MSALLEYRECIYEVGAHMHTHGRHEGLWSPTFKIFQTPAGKTPFESGENTNGPHPKTKQEAEALAKLQVKAWVDSHWIGFVPE